MGAELGDDVGVVLAVVDVVDLDDVVGISELPQDLDFRAEEGAVHILLDHFHVDDLDGHFPIYIENG